MRGFVFDALCLCGGEFVYVNGAHPSSYEACAIVKCVNCGHEYGVHVALQQITPLDANRRRKRCTA